MRRTSLVIASLGVLSAALAVNVASASTLHVSSALDRAQPHTLVMHAPRRLVLASIPAPAAALNAPAGASAIQLVFPALHAPLDRTDPWSEARFAPPPADASKPTLDRVNPWTGAVMAPAAASPHMELDTSDPWML